MGLLIVDEEQHFGVKHKEKLKKLKSDIHVLTLTATPIPRTMQLAMTGVKDLSIIASPPIDRRSIETFIFKRDSIVIKEALLNEKKRGGQSFYIVPRIKDISTIEEFIKEKIPEINYVVAHGQMSSTNLENRMHDFYEGNYDVLIGGRYFDEYEKRNNVWKTPRKESGCLQGIMAVSYTHLTLPTKRIV